MTSRTLLALDYSTTCTGYALFDIESKKLVTHGRVQNKPKNDPNPWKKKLNRIDSAASDAANLITQFNPTVIVIEEITGSRNRIGQKTLDGAHIVLWFKIQPYLDKVFYYDPTGAQGWRTHLQLRLSDADKEANKEAKILNKKVAKKQQLPTVGPKQLACRYVNHTYGLSLSVDENEFDADEADAIAMGSAFLQGKLAKTR